MIQIRLLSCAMEKPFHELLNSKIIWMSIKLKRARSLLLLVFPLFFVCGCSYETSSMKLKRASFNRCVYSVDQRVINWDVRAFVHEDSDSKEEELIISINLVVEDFEDLGTYTRKFKLRKVRVSFGSDMVYQGKDFDHNEWLGPSMGSSNNMLRLSKKEMGEGNLSVVLWLEDDAKRQYRCETSDVKVGKI